MCFHWLVSVGLGDGVFHFLLRGFCTFGLCRRVMDPSAFVPRRQKTRRLLNKQTFHHNFLKCLSLFLFLFCLIVLFILFRKQTLPPRLKTTFVWILYFRHNYIISPVSPLRIHKVLSYKVMWWHDMYDSVNPKPRRFFFGRSFMAGGEGRPSPGVTPPPSSHLSLYGCKGSRNSSKRHTCCCCGGSNCEWRFYTTLSWSMEAGGSRKNREEFPLNSKFRLEENPALVREGRSRI